MNVRNNKPKPSTQHAKCEGRLSAVLREAQGALEKGGYVHYERGVRERVRGQLYSASAWETLILCRKDGRPLRRLTRVQVERAARSGLLLLPEDGLPSMDLTASPLVLHLSSKAPVIGATRARSQWTSTEVLWVIEVALKKQGYVRYERHEVESWVPPPYHVEVQEQFVLCKRGGSPLRLLTRKQVERAVKTGLLTLPTGGLPEAKPQCVAHKVIFLMAREAVTLDDRKVREISP